MNREQEEMQTLGIFGIYLEAYRVILRHRRIFSQIALSLILPCSLIFLSHHEISHYLNLNTVSLHGEIVLELLLHRHLISSQFTIFQCIFNVFYFSFLLILSLLSTSAIVYTVACSYTGKELITFKNVMTVVPKVWKRVTITFFYTLMSFIAYNIVAAATLFLWSISLVDTFLIDAATLVIMFITYTAGFIYMAIIWNLASVVSVLEQDSCGFKAMIRGKELIKGKMVIITLVVFCKLNLSMAAVRMLFDEYVVVVVVSRSGFLVLLGRIGLGMICLLLVLKLILFGLVIQTVTYFVCKSYHNEKIDISALSDHLEVYEYVSL